MTDLTVEELWFAMCFKHRFRQIFHHLKTEVLNYVSTIVTYSMYDVTLANLSTTSDAVHALYESKRLLNVYQRLSDCVRIRLVAVLHKKKTIHLTT